MRGQINPGIEEGEENFWTIDLPAGYHHIFLDLERGDGSFGTMSVQVDDVDAVGARLDTLFQSYDIGYRARSGGLFLNDAPRTLTLRFAAGRNNLNAPQDYVMGVFANGRSIPSPYFDDCPTITALSLGSTAAFRLESSDEATDTAIYQIDLPQGDYELSSQATRSDGQDGTISYMFETSQGFWEKSEGSKIASVYDVQTKIATQTDSFSRSEGGPVWLSITHERGNSALDVEFTIISKGN